MITNIKIVNYALIESLEISFSKGMSCITGETGAGKSILIGGLSLVLGKRADLNILRDNSKKCIVEASFKISDYSLENFFEESKLDYDSVTVLRREIIPSGKSRAFINDTPVTLEKINQLSSILIDVHSQHENESLFKSEYQFLVLDALSKNNETLFEYNNCLTEFNKIKKTYNNLVIEAENSKKDIDYNKYLLDELEKEDLYPNTLLMLEDEIDVLSNVEDLQFYISRSIRIIEDDDIGLINQLSLLKSELSLANKKSKTYLEISDRISSIEIDLKDILDDLSRKFDQLESNPSRLEMLNDKLSNIRSLLTKHNLKNITDLIDLKNKLKFKVNEIVDIDVKIQKLKNKLSDSEKNLNRLANIIHENRKVAIPILCKEMENVISRMGMQNSKFKIELVPSDNFFKNGKDHLDFIFSSNLGSDFKKLKKVASGGEMSRIMLSIKYILSQYKKLPTIVFDEIDTGVSGTISNEIGNLMSEMSKYMQVFTITHSPQIAAKGNHHFKVFKEIDDSSTHTKIKKMDKNERVQEVAGMLSGAGLSQTALEHARQLLN